MYVSRLRRDERGGILALSAILIPVFIVITALVVDVGQWYTHKRQLQNRADAAAFAAGTEYAKNWKGCVQTGNTTLKATTALKIANAGRQYAGDPESADYLPGTMPGTIYNKNIANQSKLDVVVNSPTYDDDTDYQDGGGSPPQGNPCFPHAGDAISPGTDVYWTDVRVKENDLPSLFGSIGLPLRRNVARARIEIRPALSAHRFLPLAIPDNVILKTQVRYYDECRNTLLATKDLYELPSTAYDASTYAASGGGGLWALPLAGQTVGNTSQSFPLTLPSYGGCGQDYLPIGVEVRIASQPNINLNLTCAQLVAARYADCFRRVSQFRIYNDGNADSQPRLTNVRVLNGCQTPQDGYFSMLPTGALNCRYDVSAEVDWGTRDDPPLNVPGNFTVTANGVNLPLSSWTTPGGTAIYQSSGGALTGTGGANNVRISLNWEDHNPAHQWPAGTQCRTGNNTPCKYSGTQDAHQAFVGTSATSGAVGLVRTSVSPWVTSGTSVLPGPPLENIATGGNTVNIYPAVGIKSTLKAGVFTLLRLEDPQGSQLIDCDPAVAPGQTFDNFVSGCQPWYAVNSFANGPWWNTTTQSCPSSGLWFTSGTAPAPYGKNSAANPWRCVNLNTGSKNGQVGNWMSVATKNCSNIGGNQCHNIVCNYDGNYDGKPGNPNGWVQLGGDSGYPRVVSLFIIPYQSLKGVTGTGETAPVIGFANFYVMNFTGANAGKSDQCPDNTFNGVTMPPPDKGEITGVYVEAVDYEPGPVDPTATCVEGQLIPCRVTLVR